MASGPVRTGPLLCVACTNGYHHVAAAETKPCPNRSGSGKGYDGTALCVYRILPVLSLGAGTVLGREQYAVHCPTVGDYQAGYRR